MMTGNVRESELKVAHELVQRFQHAPNVLRDGSDGFSIILVPDGAGGWHIQSAKPFEDERKEEPDRVRGIATFADLDSFIEHIKRFSTPEASVIYGRRDLDAPHLMAIYNYHQDETIPGWGDHGARFTFPLSREFQDWREANKGRMSQSDFAELLENRISDVIDPTEAGDSLQTTIRALGMKAGAQAELMGLSRGIQVNAGETVRNMKNLTTGEFSIEYGNTHSGVTDVKGERIVVPSAFVIQIPLFDGGAHYQILVLLRYRRREGLISWTVELHRLDRVMRHAIDEAVTMVKSATDLPLWFGAPGDFQAYQPEPAPIRVSRN